jgi:hypothetical protein
MDPATWMTLIVPALAAIAVGDSLTGLSASLSRKLGLTNRLWIHIAILFACSVTFIACLTRLFPDYTPLEMIDYANVENHVFSLLVAPRLLIFEVLFLIPCCMVAALLISIKQRRNVPLSVIAAMLGNIGTIVWMIRDKAHTDF